MSIESSIDRKSSFSKANIKEIRLRFPESHLSNFKISETDIIKKLDQSNFHQADESNKNGSIENEAKNGFKYLNEITPKIENRLKNIKFHSSNLLPIIKKKEGISINERNYERKSLEFEQDKFRDLGDFSKNPEFSSHIFDNSFNYELYEKLSPETTLISRVFCKKLRNSNNNIAFNHINNFVNGLYLTNNCEILNLKDKIKDNNIITNDINPIKNKKNEKNKIKNINFNIKENFLINFNIKEIKVKNIEINQLENDINDFGFKDMEYFINNLCYKKFENLNFFEKEYIEIKKIDKIEKKAKTFLLKKRKNSFDFNEIENLCQNENINIKKGRKSLSKKKSLKSDHKNNHKKITQKIKKLNKINNKKNGIKIRLYLNQIKINKNKLENFPFFPMLNIKENIKVEFLKGIIERKDLIKINRKANLIKDYRNLKYVYNKKFEIIYQNENDMQYILHINSFNIFYLILFYYYQIKEKVELINKYHYSHSSFIKSKELTNTIEDLIKKCNKIVNEITKCDI